jgi:membrane protein implicated in regulation of membrane protease activity
MIVVFLGSLIGGLLYGVRVMIVGVERARPFDAAGERSFRLSPPILVAFAVVFGLAGYLFTRRGVGGGAAAGFAALLGGLAAGVTARLVREWWKVTPEHDVDDERYVLQGHLARVVTPIGPHEEGEVAFEVESTRRVVRARSVDDGALAAETEVVIERIEDGVAYVEPWLEVEKRL